MHLYYTCSAVHTVKKKRCNTSPFVFVNFFAPHSNAHCTRPLHTTIGHDHGTRPLTFLHNHTHDQSTSPHIQTHSLSHTTLPHLLSNSTKQLSIIYARFVVIPHLREAQHQKLKECQKHQKWLAVQNTQIREFRICRSEKIGEAS